MDATRRLHLLLLLALAVVPFLPALDGEFLLWDDAEFVQGNPLVRPLGGEELRAIFDPARIGAVEGIYIPLTDLSLAVDCTIFRGSPRAYHAVNIAMHACASLLLYLCLLRLPLSPLLAFLAAALFAVHPVHVESVAWLSCRKDVLSMCLFAGALLLAMDATDATDGRGRRAVGASLLFAMALLAKPTTIVLPLLLLAWAASRGRVRASLPALVPLVLLAGGGLALQVWMGQRYGVVRGAVAEGLPHRLLEMGRVFPRYLWNLAFPTRLSARYDWRTFGRGLDAETIAALSACGAYALAVLLSRRRAPRVSLALAWVPLALLPVAQVVPTGLYMADKYLYLPSIGACVLGALWVGEAEGLRGARLRAGLSIALLALFGVLTWSRCEDWRDTRVLLSDALQAAPDSGNVNRILGVAWAEQGRVDRAETCMRRAVRLSPGDFGVWNDLGKLELQLGQLDQAEADLQRALALRPGYGPALAGLAAVRTPQAWLDAGITLYRRRRIADAEAAFRRGLKLDEAHVALRSSLATVLIERKAYSDALDQVNHALSVRPSDPKLRCQRGYVEFLQGQYKQAIADLTGVVEADEGMRIAWVLLARSYDADGQGEKALDAWKRVQRDAPDNAEASGRVQALEVQRK